MATSAAPIATDGAHGAIVKRQLIHAVHHNRCKYDEQWFGKGECVLVTEKVTYANGHREKRLLRMESPTVIYKVTAEAYRAEQKVQEPFFPLDKCDEYESPVNHIDRHAADLTGQMDFFNETRGPGQSMRRRKIHEQRWLHGTDVNLCDHYLDRYIEAYKDVLDTDTPLDFAVADIEVDGVDHEGFPDEFDGPCPVNLISYFSRDTKTVTQWILRNSVRPNPLIAQFEAKLPLMHRRVLAETNRGPLTKAKLATAESSWEEVDAILQGNPAARELMRCTESKFRFFDDEIEMILDFLDFVNEDARPDVLGWWNASFDINTIISRLRRKRIDPHEAFSSSDAAPWAYCDYRRDDFNTQPTDKGDIFLAACPTIYVDLMLQYAALRKQEQKKESYTLEFTLQAELGEGKLGYDGSIRDLPYRDFDTFVAYGAVDVVPLVSLENQVEDTALAYRISMLTRTRFHKVMKKTICLRNLASVFLREQGYAISNNHNRNAERNDTEQFLGGFVVDPMLMDRAGIEVGGSNSDRVFDGVVDLDATSLYPSLILMCNIDPSSQIGRLLFQLPDGSEVETSEFVMAVAGGDEVEMGRLWFGLPGLGELAADVLGMEALRCPGLIFDGLAEEEIPEADPEEELALETAGDEANWNESNRPETAGE